MYYRSDSDSDNEAAQSVVSNIQHWWNMYCRSDSDSDNEGDPEKKKLQDKLSGII